MILLSKKIFAAEPVGAAFTALGSWFMLSLYKASGGELLGILFGAVNNSAWEHCKTLLLPYLIWSILELLSFKPQVRHFTVAKTASLYALGLLYLLLKAFGASSTPAAAVSIAAAFICVTAEAPKALYARRCTFVCVFRALFQPDAVSAEASAVL